MVDKDNTLRSLQVPSIGRLQTFGKSGVVASGAIITVGVSRHSISNSRRDTIPVQSRGSAKSSLNFTKGKGLQRTATRSNLFLVPECAVQKGADRTQVCFSSIRVVPMRADSRLGQNKGKERQETSEGRKLQQKHKNESNS